MAQPRTTYTQNQLYGKTLAQLKALCRIHGIAYSTFQFQQYKLEFVDALLALNGNINDQNDVVVEDDVGDDGMNIDGLFVSFFCNVH